VLTSAAAAAASSSSSKHCFENLCSLAIVYSRLYSVTVRELPASVSLCILLEIILSANSL
jgi:hypothetical protein